MNSLFLANIELNENDGIYKKIMAQKKKKKNSSEGWLITKRSNGARVYDYQANIENTSNENIFETSKKTILEHKIGLLYIRHMIPSIKLIKFLIWSKNRKIKIFYEIPTYPFFAEQFRTAKKKSRAIAKIILNIIFFPFIYKNIDRLVVIKSNTKARMLPKMIEITNGVGTEDIIPKSYTNKDESNIFRMVAVGTIYPYHGYDRILKGLSECNEKIGDVIVEFHVVGESYTIDELKNQVKKMGLKHVVFHGIKSTSELNKLYDKFDVGLGCLALYKRNANIDTTLNIIEYYCRGIPVVTSGTSPMEKYQSDTTIYVSNNSKSIDIKRIYEQFKNIKASELKKISSIAKDKFSWNYIMSELLREVL